MHRRSYFRTSRQIPCIVVQGRYDCCCPITSAWALKKVWPELELQIVPDAGHSSREPGIAKLLVEVCGPNSSLHMLMAVLPCTGYGQVCRTVITEPCKALNKPVLALLLCWHIVQAIGQDISLSSSLLHCHISRFAPMIAFATNPT